MPKASYYRTFGAIFCLTLAAGCARLNSGDSGDPDGGISITWKVDDGGKGLVGEIFDLLDLDGSTGATLDTIDLDSRTSLPERILVENLDVPNRLFSAGFPNNPNLLRWFGLRFRGRIVLPSTGDYTFRLISDDGSQLFLDDNPVPVIDHGMEHEATAKDSVSKEWNAGSH